MTSSRGLFLLRLYPNGVVAPIGPIHGAFDDDGLVAIKAGGESLINPDLGRVVSCDGVAAVGSDGVRAGQVRAIIKHVGDGDVGWIGIRVLEQDEGAEACAGEAFGQEPGN